MRIIIHVLSGAAFEFQIDSKEEVRETTRWLADAILSYEHGHSDGSHTLRLHDTTFVTRHVMGWKIVED